MIAYIPDNPIVKNLCLNIAELQQMLEAAARLSEGFPEVRVDFYEAG